MSSHSINRKNEPVLSRIVRGYMPQEMGFVHRDLLPTLPVKALKGDINVGGDEHLKIHNRTMVGRSGTPEIVFSISKEDGWSIEEFGMKSLITKEDGSKWDPENRELGKRSCKEAKAKLLRKAMMIGDEVALSTALRDSANYDASNVITLSGTSQLSDYTNSDPVGVFSDAILEVYEDTGFEPNVAVMDFVTFHKIKYHPNLISFLSDDSERTMGLSKESLARALGVDKLLVAKVQYDTAALGQPRSMSSAWGKDIVFAYVNPNPKPTQYEESLGYRFQYEDIITDSYDVVDPKDSEYVRITEWYDNKILNFDSAYLVKDAIA